MDSNPSSDSTFDPNAILPLDSLLTPGDLAALNTQSDGGNGSGQFLPQSNIGPAPPPSGLDSILSNPDAFIPGLGAVLNLVNIIGKLPQDIEAVINTAEGLHPLPLLGKALKWVTHAGRIFEFAADDVFKIAADAGVGPIFTSMLEAGMDVHVSEFGPEELVAVQGVDTMVAFAAIFPLICTAVDTAGKALLANRWPESIGTLLGKLPEELGTSWALGLVINKAFEASQGVILEEAINKQKRPNRIGWPQLRTLLKQHLLDDTDFNLLMQAQGFPDEQIDLLKRLQDNPIPIGDISQLWYRDVIDDTQARELIGVLGFTPREIGWLFDLYIGKAETQASVTYRSTARQLFSNHLIAEEQYRTILTSAHYPKKLIADDIAAVRLEQQIGKVLQSVTVIKQRYQHKAIDGGEAKQELQELNYAPDFITEILQAWDEPALRKTHGLSQAKILSYYVSNVISRPQAEPQLLATGLSPVDVTFLLDHPTANAGVHLHTRSPGLVTQAYTDGVIDQSALRDAYKSAGVRSEDLDWYVNIAKYRLAHKRGAPGANIPLNAGEYKQGFKAGLIDFPTLVSALESLGYSPENAMFLAEIENKGPNLPVRPPAFPNLQAALRYLTAHGFTLIPPPDPQLLAAEGMAAAAGYSWTSPPSVPPGESRP